MNQDVVITNQDLQRSNFVSPQTSQDSMATPRCSQHHSLGSLHRKPSEDIDSKKNTVTKVSGSNETPKRIGWVVLCTIITSFAVLIAATVFLSWLWFGNNETESWRRMMLSGRSTQAVTLSGVLIRWAIGSLAVITTSMAASIAVELHGVPKSVAAEVSIARFTNSGPQSFMKLLLSATFNAWLRVSIGFLLILTLASQFTSTLLVADLQELRVSSFGKNMSYGFDFKPLRSMDGIGPLPLFQSASYYWNRRPSSSEIFAEYSQPGTLEDNIDDTGATLRAFLPIAVQSERENLQSFQGMARVIDARVICAQPTFSGSFCYNPNSSTGYYLCLNVTADLSKLSVDILDSDPRAVGKPEVENKRFSGQFSCPIPDNSPDAVIDEPMKNWLLCTDNDGVGLASLLRNETSVDSTMLTGDSSYLLIDRLSTPDQIDDHEIKMSNTTWKHLNSSASGPWIRQWSRATSNDGKMEQDYHLQMSLCFTAKGSSRVGNLNITGSTSSNHTEPTYQYDVESNRYNTSGVLHQLGVTRQSDNTESQKRGILGISEEDMLRSLDEIREKPIRPPYMDEITSWLPVFVDPKSPQDLAICAQCEPSTSQWGTTSALLSQIFNDVITSTDSPALALQAVYTMVFRMAYYDHISSFSLAPNPARITSFDIVQAPGQALGLVTVIIIIAGNVIVFIIITVIFLLKTRSSFIDNAWHTIAQVSQSEEVGPIVERARFAADQDIQKWLRGQESSSNLRENVRDLVKEMGHVLSQKEVEYGEKFQVSNEALTGISLDAEQNDSPMKDGSKDGDGGSEYKRGECDSTMGPAYSTVRRNE